MLDNYQKVLVGIDGSDLSEKAFEQAVAIAKRNQSELYIAQIIPDMRASYTAAAISANILNDEKDAVQKRLVEKVAYAKEQGIEKVKPILKVSSPQRELAVLIPEDYDIDLIVLGVSGKGAIERFVMGSVAQYVSVHAKASVLLIK